MVERIKRNRRDHYLPQSYLRGFADPARLSYQQPLWHFDVPNQIWSERSPREFAYRHGFYDYSKAAIGAETADSAFAELETQFPLIVNRLISKGFANWRNHLEFFLRYMQMIRARSLLFFDQKLDEGKRLQAWVVEEVSPDRKSLRLRSMVPESLSPEFIRNWTITEMRAEIGKGAAWLTAFNWALRYCDSVSDPFIISEIPLVAFGPASTAVEGIQNPETLLFFPLCWRACLIGSRQYFEVETSPFESADMHRTRKIYRDSAKLFLVSPAKLLF